MFTVFLRSRCRCKISHDFGGRFPVTGYSVRPMAAFPGSMDLSNVASLRTGDIRDRCTSSGDSSTYCKSGICPYRSFANAVRARTNRGVPTPEECCLALFLLARHLCVFAFCVVEEVAAILEPPALSHSCKDD